MDDHEKRSANCRRISKVMKSTTDVKRHMAGQQLISHTLYHQC